MSKAVQVLNAHVKEAVRDPSQTSGYLTYPMAIKGKLALVLEHTFGELVLVLRTPKGRAVYIPMANVIDYELMSEAQVADFYPPAQAKQAAAA